MPTKKKSTPKAKKYEMTVSSAGFKATVKAADFDAAFALFLKKANPTSLGTLTEIVAPGYDPDGIDDTWYCLTQRMLDKLGKWSNT